MADAQKLYRMDDRVSGVRLKVDDLFAAPQIGRELLRFLDADAGVSDWTRSHANFFRAVEIEKRMMFLILLPVSYTHLRPAPLAAWWRAFPES